MATEIRAVDGQGLTLYSMDNTSSSVIKAETNTLRLDAGGTVLLGRIGAGSNLVFEESSSITGQGTNTITLGQSGDTFNFNVASVTYNFGTMTGNITMSNNLSVTGTLTVAGVTTFNGNVTFAAAKTLTVGTGATSLGGTLGVTGATTLSSTLTVAGTTTFNGNVTFGAGVTLTVGTGATSLGGTLSVTGTSTFTGLVTIPNNSKVKGSGVGVANISWLGFYESNATTRTGWVGDSKNVNSDIELGSDAGNVVLSANGAVLTAKRSGGVDIIGNISTTGKMGIGQAAHTAADAVLAITVPTTGTVMTGTDKYGGIHLQQTTTTGEFVGITASGRSTTAGTMAGILFEGSTIASADRAQIHFLTADSYTNGMQNRMTLDYMGNLGLGTTTPSTKLHIKQALGAGVTGYEMTLQSGNDSSGTRHGIEFKGSDGNVEARIVTGNYGSYNSSIGFETGAGASPSLTTTQRLLINYDGKIAIGNFTPTITLAIGDSDTGINRTADGNIQLYANNQNVIALTSTSIALNKNTSVAGASTFTVGTGATSLGGTLAVTGATTLNGNTSVAGTSTFTVGAGATSLGGTLTVTDNTTLTGSVGIGGAPSYKLDVITNTDGHQMRVGNATVKVTTWASASAGVGSIGTLTNHDFKLYANNTDVLTVSKGGNVGIGNASPTSKLDVNGNVNITGTLTATTINQNVVNIANKYSIEYNATQDSLDFVYT